jgi:hypothetical protein
MWALQIIALAGLVLLVAALIAEAVTHRLVASGRPAD